MNFQQMVVDLTGLEIANACCSTSHGRRRDHGAPRVQVQIQSFFVDELLPADHRRHQDSALACFELSICLPDSVMMQEVFGALFQYPGDSGVIKATFQFDRAISRAPARRRRLRT